MSAENKSLIELNQDYGRLMNLLMEAGGELSPELEQELQVNQEMLAAKADKYDFVISKLELEEEYWKAQADKYLRVARACNAARSRMRDSIKVTMQMMDKTEIVGETTTFKLVKGAPKLVFDHLKLPDEYVIETVVRETNKDKLKDDLKAGKVITGAQLEPVIQLRTSVSKKVK